MWLFVICDMKGVTCLQLFSIYGTTFALCVLLWLQYTYHPDLSYCILQ
jgi:hypothetical protein